MNILVTGSLPNNEIERLEKNGFSIFLYGVRDLVGEDDLIEALHGKDFYLLGGDERVTENVINSTDKLKHIAFLGTGYKKFIDGEAAFKKGVVVTNTPGANKQAVAEMVVGLVLSVWRKILYLDETTKKGEWNTEQMQDLRGKTLGIIGMGNVGTVVAQIMKRAFDMNIVYFSRTRKNDIEKEIGTEFMPLEEVLKVSDIVSLHIPLNSVTKDFISTDELSIMKKDSLLINTARAEIVNGDALYKALVNDSISAAAFDGYYAEPSHITPENDFSKLSTLSNDRFIVTPHTAFRTSESNVSMFKMAIDAVLDIKNNKESKYIVKTSMKKALIIHGTGGNPEENWIPWLRSELEARDFQVIAPSFPSGDGQNLDNWMKVVESYLPELEGELSIVGHSVGATFILSILERLEQKAKTAVLVSGFLKSLGFPEFDVVNKTFHSKDFDWNKIKNNVEKICIFHSDNDPYVPLSESEYLAAKLDLVPTVFPGGGHLNEAAGYTEFPEIVKCIK